MFGRLGHRMIAAAGYSSMAAAVWAGSGYLPKAGPLPMRFCALPLLRTNWVSAPAPAPSDADDLMDDELGDSSAPKPVVIPPLTGSNGGGSNAVVLEVSSASAAQPAQEPVISPQMLIQYFRPSTNGAAPGATEPVGFLQPPPGASAPGAKGAGTINP